MSDKKIKISVYVTKDEFEKIKVQAEKYQMSVSTMAINSIKLGLLAFDLATDPKMAKIYEKKFDEVMDEKK